MASFEEVFKRKEMKYVLDARQRRLFEAAVAERLVPGKFGTSEIRSLYYDTPEFALIERSLDKPVYKEKLRLRTYGKPSPDGHAFVEIKKKFKGVVYKRRVPMSLAAAEAYLAGMSYEDACRAFPLADPDAAAQSLSARSMQISREVDFMLERNDGLAPSMLTRCVRDAYEDPDGSGLRITFDSSLDCLPEAGSIRDNVGFEPIIPQGLSVMEAKNAGPLPLWMVDALNEAEARPQSFSKYGRAYMLGRIERKARCA